MSTPTRRRLMNLLDDLRDATASERVKNARGEDDHVWSRGRDGTDVADACKRLVDEIDREAGSRSGQAENTAPRVTTRIPSKKWF